MVVTFKYCLNMEIIQPPWHMQFIGKMYNFTAVCNNHITKAQLKEINKSNFIDFFSEI